MELSEPDIIANFKKGDQRSETYVFHLFHKALFYFATNLIDDGEEARDIVAESFIKLWERREGFEEMRSIKAFLFIATRNACFDFLKANKRKNASKKELFYLAEEAVSPAEIMHAEIKAEMIRILAAEIDGLPKQCRTIFKLIFFEHLSTAEIAERLGIAKKTVLSQKARAVSLLKTSLLKRDLMVLYSYIIIHSIAS